MRISIAMATYNGSRYIGEQLASLAEQTFLPYELVVTDDGSTDDTLAIVERFATHAPFIVRIHRNSQRLNYADNFLRAASLCGGDWIAFCDQDDVWLKDKLETVAQAARLPGVSMVVHAVRTVDAELHPVRGVMTKCRVHRGRHPGRLPPFGFFSGLCMTFDSALLPLILVRPRVPDPNDLSYEAAHDRWVCAICDAAGSVRYIRKELVLYRQHGLNTCGATSNDIGLRLKQSAGAGASTYLLGAEMASNYIEMFERLAASTQGARWQANLKEAARRYGQARQYLRERAALYRTTNLPSRLAALAKLSLFRMYRFNPMRPPLHAFAKDVYFVMSHLFRTPAAVINEAKLREQETAPPEHNP
jgi:glycosyltransferase involved in cell wall biosynthesis